MVSALQPPTRVYGFTPHFLLQQYAPLLAVFSSQGQSELILLQKVQEYCYDNIHFMKAFQKIVVLFYKGVYGCMLFCHCMLLCFVEAL